MCSGHNNFDHPTTKTKKWSRDTIVNENNSDIQNQSLANNETQENRSSNVNNMTVFIKNKNDKIQAFESQNKH